MRGEGSEFRSNSVNVSTNGARFHDGASAFQHKENRSGHAKKEGLYKDERKEKRKKKQELRGKETLGKGTLSIEKVDLG